MCALNVVGCSKVSLCLYDLDCDRISVKALTFPVFLNTFIFCAVGLAAWEEYPSLKMLMEMVMTKLVCLDPSISGVLLNSARVYCLLPF